MAIKKQHVPTNVNNLHQECELVESANIGQLNLIYFILTYLQVGSIHISSK